MKNINNETNNASGDANGSSSYATPVATGIDVAKLKAILPAELIASNESEFNVLDKLMLNMDTLHELTRLTARAVHSLLGKEPSFDYDFEKLMNFIQANVFCVSLKNHAKHFLAKRTQANSANDSQGESLEELYVSSDVALNFISLSNAASVSQISLGQCDSIMKAMGLLISIVNHGLISNEELNYDKTKIN